MIVSCAGQLGSYLNCKVWRSALANVCKLGLIALATMFVMHSLQQGKPNCQCQLAVSCLENQSLQGT